MSQFVVHRLLTKPIEYTVRIKHFVLGGAWTMSVCVQDVAEDDINKRRVADDLRAAAEMLEGKLHE